MPDHKTDDAYETRVKDLLSGVNKEYVNEKFLKKAAGGNHFDLKGFNIKNGDPYYDGLYGDNDLVSKRYVDEQNAKQDIAINDKLSKYGADRMEGALDMDNKKIVNVGDTTQQDGDAINYRYFNRETGVIKRLINNVSGQAVQRDGSDPMTGNLNMARNKITNLYTDSKDLFSAANVRHVNNEKANLLFTLTTQFDDKIEESHITSSASKKDAFRYIMEEVNESTSESNIIVDGIKDFPASPHDVNKKAYLFRMGKGSQNGYLSRLGLNMFKLPDEEYTLVIEFFPPSMDRVTVSVVSTSLNIGQQSTKLFPKYSRSIVHLHKYDITPPEYIYVDMRCQGTASTPAQGVGRLIVYGIEGKQNDVDSDVYDALYAVEKGKMAMQTDLSLKDHHLRGLSVDEKDETSAVSIRYLSKELVLPRFEDLFHFFIDFRSPNTFSVSESANKISLLLSGAASNPFQFNTYNSKTGLFQKNNDVKIASLGTAFNSPLIAGVLKNGFSLKFEVNGVSQNLSFQKNQIKIGDGLANLRGADFDKKTAIDISFIQATVQSEIIVFSITDLEDGAIFKLNLANQKKLFDFSSVSLVSSSEGSFLELFG